ncbi:MAG: AAA family ATPase [Clostridia bacterium]|nr:AAA family ATPase [Clostridia bacterium]
MELNSIINVSIDPSSIVLSDASRIFKTEQFIKQTRGLIDVDKYLAVLSDGILLALKDGKIKSTESYILSSIDGVNSFFIKFGETIKNKKLLKLDIVFFKFITKDSIKHEDRRFVRLTQKQNVDVSIKRVQDVQNLDFQKLYILSNADKVNFPLLNEEQEQIVTQENNNIVVQGVAGSGKTNICIDRVVYAASRRYRGKIIYSTYSHALLEDTKNKVALFNSNIKTFNEALRQGKVTFIGKNKKSAIENKLGIWLDVDAEENIIKTLSGISHYLENNVDYMLIEDLYNKALNKDIEFTSEQYFVNTYLKNIKNYNLKSNIEKIKYIAQEVIYKEIYGLIFGYVKEDDAKAFISQEEYIELRKESFTRQEATIIYMIAMDYYKFQKEHNLVDNNIASRYLIENKSKVEKYSLCILDEVQDFTQINLYMFKELSYKMFCVGDALQMINPAYFSFAFLKRLMFEDKYLKVSELRNNYRNSKKIEKIIDNLSELNIEQFGTHSFVLRGKSIDDDMLAKTIYLNDGNFTNLIANKAYSDVTIVVNSIEKKNELRKVLPKQEILTISEIKGLERSFVILMDVLSDNSQKWDVLNRTIISKKKAEENSVYRYYFNLFYVGLTRAKQNLFVIERKKIDLFKNFFDENFEELNQKGAFDLLDSIASKVDLDREEILQRIEEFIKHEQYDNARFLLEKLDAEDAKLQEGKINIFEKYVRRNQNRQAGVELWKIGLLEDAKTQFRISNDDRLIDLIDACENNGSNLEYDIVEFYPQVRDNEIARQLILDTLSDDLKTIKDNQQNILNSIKRRR